mmetsp:Transcript_2642/g.9376  ORF Transcript_2642/g.9376 Transcript_2642/m.9376 type:complete len:444 (+) Transcript_2642:281-1612(+)
MEYVRGTAEVEVAAVAPQPLDFSPGNVEPTKLPLERGRDLQEALDDNHKVLPHVIQGIRRPSPDEGTGSKHSEGCGRVGGVGPTVPRCQEVHGCGDGGVGGYLRAGVLQVTQLVHHVHQHADDARFLRVLLVPLQRRQLLPRVPMAWAVEEVQKATGAVGEVALDAVLEGERLRRGVVAFSSAGGGGPGGAVEGAAVGGHEEGGRGVENAWENTIVVVCIPQSPRRAPVHHDLPKIALVTFWQEAIVREENVVLCVRVKECKEREIPPLHCTLPLSQRPCLAHLVQLFLLPHAPKACPAQRIRPVVPLQHWPVRRVLMGDLVVAVERAPDVLAQFVGLLAKGNGLAVDIDHRWEGLVNVHQVDVHQIGEVDGVRPGEGGGGGHGEGGPGEPHAAIGIPSLLGVGVGFVEAEGAVPEVVRVHGENSARVSGELAADGVSGAGGI